MGTTITTPTKPPPVQEPVAPTLKIDGVVITIPVPAEGVDTINLSAVVSNGTVADFEDPSGVLAGKTINLTLSAPGGQDRINYSAISAIENSFNAKGASPISDTAAGVIPVFNSYFDLDANTDAINNLIYSKNVSAQTPEAHVINNIKVFYNDGNPILRVQSPMQLTGRILLSDLKNIQADSGMIYADETLRLGTNRTTFSETELNDFLEAYKACGFVVSPNTDISATETYFDTDINATQTNKFFPKPGYLNLYNTTINMDITGQQSSWGIYKLYEQYYHAGKLDNLSHLVAQNITVAGENAAGLYGSDNQPLASFPYKVNGQVIGSMAGRFKAFENMFENTGNFPDSSSPTTLIVKNFATNSNNLPNTRFTASGACFFLHASGVISSTGAVKIGNISELNNIRAKYLDLRDLSIVDAGKVRNQGMLGEIAFASLGSVPQTYDARSIMNYDTGYYVDSDGVTKLIPVKTGTYLDGPYPHSASNQTSSIYGVLELQNWTVENPPRTMTEEEFNLQSSIVINP